MPGLGDRLRGLFGKSSQQAGVQVDTVKDEGRLDDAKAKLSGFVDRATDKVDNVVDDVVDEVKDRTKD
jgi:hypothetical protein